MKQTQVIMKGYVFNVTVNDEGIPITVLFTVQDKKAADMTEEELRFGCQLAQHFYDGTYNWLLKKERVIDIPIYNIRVDIRGIEYDGSVKFSSGTITSSLKEICEHCRNLDCDWDCEAAQNWMNITDALSYESKKEELENNRKYNHAADAIESVILAHAIAGVDIETIAYIEGIETAIDAIGNNL